MIDIVWNCGIDTSGYSNCARSYIKALHENSKCTVKVLIENIARNINLVGIDRDDLDLFSSLSTKSCGDKEYLIQHTVPDRFIFGRGKNIIYTVVELPPPDRWKAICNNCELIMTASNFCKDLMIESGIDSELIEVIPHCHDIKQWNPSVKPLNIGNLKDFNFLFVGDYTPRKGGDLLIKSFIETFRGNKNVSLTMKAFYSSFSKEDQLLLFSKMKKTIEETGVPKSERPTIYFYSEPILENLMPRFMASFDCLVSPHRGEGWGLSMSSMMCLGKPVISTNYSGNLEFMNDENSFLVDIDGFEPVCKEMLFINPNYQGREWLTVSRDSLCEKMLKVYENPSLALKKGNQAAKDMSINFSFEEISNKIVSSIEAKFGE